MAEEVGKLLIKLEADVKGLKKDLNNVTKEVKNTANKSSQSLLSFKKVAETALGFGFANLASRAVGSMKNLAIDGVKAALSFERGLNALEFQTKGTANALIEDLRKASNSTVSSLKLVTTANKALALGISQNQLPQLMEVATARARVMGITTTQAFNDIATGIGRQSKLILDNLGIVVDLEKAYSRYADELGISTEQLSDFQKKQALTNQIIKESEGLTIALTAAQADQLQGFEQLNAFWEEYQLTLGKDVTLAMQSVRNAYRDLTAQIGDTVLIDSAKESILNIGRTIQDLNTQTTAASDSIKSLKTELNNIRNISIEGQAAFDVKEQEKINEIDKLKLKLLDEQDNAIQNQSDKSARINELTREGLSLSEAVGQANIEFKSQESVITDEIKTKEEELNRLRLERKIEAQNELLIAQKRGKLRLEEVEQTEKSLKDVRMMVDETINQILQAKDLKAQNTLIKDLYNDQVIALSRQTRELSKQEVKAKRIAIFATLAQTGLFGTSVSSIGASVKAFSSLATPTADNIPTAMAGPVQQQKAPVIFNIENIFGMDPDQVSSALGDQLNASLR